MKGKLGDKARINHILESIQLIEDNIKEISFEEKKSFRIKEKKTEVKN